MCPTSDKFDIVLVGGGLANALVALRVLKDAPGRSVALVECGARLGGNHTWSFHLGDVDTDPDLLLDELVEYRWPAYSVSFPRLSRRIATGYASLTSRRLHQVCADAFERSATSELLLRRHAQAVETGHVVLDDRRVLLGDLVID